MDKASRSSKMNLQKLALMTYISDPRARSLHSVSPSTQGYCCQNTPKSYGRPAKIETANILSGYTTNDHTLRVLKIT
jgi:hypothetical protein